MKLVMFELLENLEAGQTAKAQVLQWTGTRYLRNGPVITLHDFVGEHGIAGDRGYCVQSDVSGLWEAVSGLFSQEFPRLG